MTGRCTPVAAADVRALFEFAVSRGADRELLSERSGICWNEDHVPFESYVALLRASKELCGDPAFALHFGECVEGSVASFPCMTEALSQTMAEGLGQSTGSAERFQLVPEGGDFWIVDTRDNFPEGTESSFARSVCMARRMFPGSEFIKAVHFTHAEPSYRAEYDRIFRMPIVFGSDRNAVLFDAAALNQRPQGPSRFVLAVIKARVESLLERPENSHSTRRRVETQIESLLHTGDVGVEAVAQKLGLSRHTLFRRLRAEGVTFKRVLEDLRHRLALDYLTSRNASVNETAYLIGFSDAAAFSRAFKRWTGKSPRSFASPASATSPALHPRT